MCKYNDVWSGIILIAQYLSGVTIFYDSQHLSMYSGIMTLSFVLVVPKPGTVIKMPETGTTITYSTATAESVAPNGTKVTLHGLDLWSEFHKSTTEMIITKAGRYRCISV